MRHAAMFNSVLNVRVIFMHASCCMAMIQNTGSSNPFNPGNEF